MSYHPTGCRCRYLSATTRRGVDLSADGPTSVIYGFPLPLSSFQRASPREDSHRPSGFSAGVPGGLSGRPVGQGRRVVLAALRRVKPIFQENLRRAFFRSLLPLRAILAGSTRSEKDPSPRTRGPDRPVVHQGSRRLGEPMTGPPTVQPTKISAPAQGFLRRPLPVPGRSICPAARACRTIASISVRTSSSARIR